MVIFFTCGIQKCQIEGMPSPQVADNCALTAHTEKDLKPLVGCFSTILNTFWSTISMQKTEVLCQVTLCASKSDSTIKISNVPLRNVKEFNYPDSHESSSSTLDKEICRHNKN